MTITLTRRAVLAAALVAALALPALGAGQADAALLGGVLRPGHPRADDAAVRRGDRRRVHLRALLRRQPVQAGHRARRAAARQPRDGQHRAAGHRQPGAGVLDPDLGLPVPRRRPHARLLRQRPRQGDDRDGRGAARHPHPRADLLRHPAGRAEARDRDQDARRTWPGSSCGCPAATPGSSSARRSAPTRRRWPTPRSTPACRPARSTARTTRCRTCRT